MDSDDTLVAGTKHFPVQTETRTSMVDGCLPFKGPVINTKRYRCKNGRGEVSSVFR